MAHHAYVIEGEAEEGIARARGFAARALSLSGAANPDIVVLRHELFSVGDARALGEAVSLANAGGGNRAIIVSATRLFHEAQNAMLKYFEEPPPGTYLFLVVPSLGLLLPTMRSRLMALPREDGAAGAAHAETGVAAEFLAASAAARADIVDDLLDRAKSDDDEEKQRARADLRRLAEGLARAAHAVWRDAKPGTAAEKDLRALLADLDRFIPLLHDRSTPLKPLFEHLMLVLPAGIR